MKRKIAGGIAGIMALVLVGQTGAVNMVYANTADTQVESTTEQQSEENAKVQELTDFTPKALSPKIGIKVADKDISTSGITALSGNSCVVSTKSAFIKKMHKYMTARKTSFTITFKGPYTKIYNAKTWENLFYSAWNIDNKSTSDDFDYLYGCVNTFGLRVPYYSKNKSVFQITVTYRESAAKLKKVNKKVKTVLKNLNLTGKSRVAKVKAIHDYIAKNVSYDNSLSRFTAYDGLVSSSHATVCQGYSNIFYKMCIEAGIPCRIMTGTATVPHAWNLVKIGSKWYFVDVTWDDTDVKSFPVKYNYFLAGSKTMNKDHTLDATFRKAAFKKKYPFSSADYEWEVAITTRSSYKNDLVNAINTSLDYDNATEVEKFLDDAYKKAMKEVVDSMTDAKFKSYVKGGTAKMKTLIQTSWNIWLSQMEDPMTVYIETDAYTEEIKAYLLTLYTQEELLAMSDEEYDKVVEEASLEVFKTAFNRIYEENKSEFITQVLAL